MYLYIVYMDCKGISLCLGITLEAIKPLQQAQAAHGVYEKMALRYACNICSRLSKMSDEEYYILLPGNDYKKRTPTLCKSTNIPIFK